MSRTLSESQIQRINELGAAFATGDYSGAAELFSIFDLNGDGSLTIEELQSIASQQGVSLSYNDALETIKSIDTNKDGAIQVQEFIEFLKKS